MAGTFEASTQTGPRLFLILLSSGRASLPQALRLAAFREQEVQTTRRRREQTFDDWELGGEMILGSAERSFSACGRFDRAYVLFAG
jgi:hypothetical protein